MLLDTKIDISILLFLLYIFPLSFNFLFFLVNRGQNCQSHKFFVHFIIMLCTYEQSSTACHNAIQFLNIFQGEKKLKKQAHSVLGQVGSKKRDGLQIGPYLIRNKMGGFGSGQQISARFSISTTYADITSGFIFIKPLIRLFTIYVLIICNIT